MAHNPQFAALATPASVVAAASGGHLSIYDGAQPAGPAVAVTTQRLLATLVVPSFDAPVISGTQYAAQANPITPVKALLTGNATWFRVLTPAGAPVFDGAAGLAPSDLVLAPSAFIAAGVTVTVASLAISGQASQAVTGTAAVTVPAPTPAPAPAPVVPSGYGGTEPVFPGAIQWCGYSWETENWGSGNGWPAAANVTVDPATGYLHLKAGMTGGNLLGAEVDSVRGDLGIAGNKSTWGYGTYRWVIGTDLTTIDPSLVLGLFTFWAYGSATTIPVNTNGKGGPYGQKEIDIEVSNWLPEGGKTGTFYMMGYYQDTGAGVASGVPATYGEQCHTMTAGSQIPVPAGHPVSTLQFTWLPASITWSIWYSDITAAVPASAPDATLTMTEGQPYSYTEPNGGNIFTGTVHIPATGGQQVICNAWSQGQNVQIPDTEIILRSFTYTPS